MKKDRTSLDVTLRHRDPKGGMATEKTIESPVPPVPPAEDAARPCGSTTPG